MTLASPGPWATRQQEAFRKGVIPEMERVAEDVYSLPLELTGSALTYSLCYLVRGAGDDVHLIDTGADTPSNWATLQDAVASIGRRVPDIRSVVVTHLHHDHLGLAGRIQAATAATVSLHRLDAAAVRDRATYVRPEAIEDTLSGWGVPEERREELRLAAADRVSDAEHFFIDELEDGDVVKLGSRTLQVVHVPGHTRGHIALVDAERGVVFSGDHLLPAVTPGVGLGGGEPGENPLADYFNSLGKMRPFGRFDVLPGHGYAFRDLGARASAIESHYRARTREVIEALSQDRDLSVWEIAHTVRWSAGISRMRSRILLSALSQTAMHARLVS